MIQSRHRLRRPLVARMAMLLTGTPAIDLSLLKSRGLKLTKRVETMVLTCHQYTVNLKIER